MISLLDHVKALNVSTNIGHEGRQESVVQMLPTVKRDAHTQMGESDSSSDPATVIEDNRSRSFYQQILLDDPSPKRKGHSRYLSKSKSPSRKRNPYQTRVQPAIPVNLDVFGILQNVAKSEGAFVSPDDALRAAIAAFTHDAW